MHGDSRQKWFGAEDSGDLIIQVGTVTYYIK